MVTKSAIVQGKLGPDPVVLLFLEGLDPVNLDPDPVNLDPDLVNLDPDPVNLDPDPQLRIITFGSTFQSRHLSISWSRM